MHAQAEEALIASPAAAAVQWQLGSMQDLHRSSKESTCQVGATRGAARSASPAPRRAHPCVFAGGAHRARARVRGGLAVTRARARECTRVSSAPACPSESGRARAGEVGAAIPGAERRLRRVSGPWRLGCCWADAGGGTERLDPVWCVVHSCVVIHGCMHAYTRACERERKGVKRGRGRPGGGGGGGGGGGKSEGGH